MRYKQTNVLLTTGLILGLPLAAHAQGPPGGLPGPRMVPKVGRHELCPTCR